MNHAVLGVGMSSKATRGEVRGVIEEVIRRADVSIEEVSFVATRMRFADDERLKVGPPVIGVEDAALLEGFPAPDRIGFAARVAEGCALLGAGTGSQLVVEPIRSAHSTVALAVAGLDGERS
jgi:cobalamin biosynthesis protein CbiG